MDHYFWCDAHGSVWQDHNLSVCKICSGSQDLHQPGVKDDGGKVDLTFVTDYFPNAIAAVARVSAFGAAKYARGGWRTVSDGVARYTAAMLRHIIRTGPRFYTESDGKKDWQLDHEAQVAWNALARLELILRED